MVRILKMKHALSNLENQIVEVNGGGQNSEARPCLYQTISIDLIINIWFVYKSGKKYTKNNFKYFKLLNT